MKEPERTEDAVRRVGAGVGNALRKAFPASEGEAIAEIYPPDAACDSRFNALIDRLEQIQWDKGGEAAA